MKAYLVVALQQLVSGTVLSSQEQQKATGAGLPLHSASESELELPTAVHSPHYKLNRLLFGACTRQY